MPKLSGISHQRAVKAFGQGDYPESGCRRSPGRKKLVGDLQGFYSVRLTCQDRTVYSIDRKNRTVFAHRSMTHYDD